MDNDTLAIVEEVKEVLEKIESDKIDKFVNMLEKDKRIFVDGEGRSGFVGKCFAMRMMHLGFDVFVMGETITPSFQEKDILLCISGSGNTGSVKLNAKKAKNTGAEVVTVTNDRESDLGTLSDYMIELDATIRGEMENRKSIQLLGSLFDQSVHLLLDAVCLKVSKRENISNSAATEKHV